jgi:hypothetical protein
MPRNKICDKYEPLPCTTSLHSFSQVSNGRYSSNFLKSPFQANEIPVRMSTDGLVQSMEGWGRAKRL